MSNKAIVARSHAKHRSTLQQQYNVQRVAELRVSGWTTKEIVDIMNTEMARDLEENEWRPVTPDMVNNDWVKAREMWKEKSIEEVSAYFYQELLALEKQNEEAWAQYRSVTAVLQGITDEVITRTQFEESGDFETAARTGNKSTTKRSREQLASEQRFWWEQIEKIAAARRKMLELDKDGPSFLIDNRRQTVVANERTNQPMKTYAIVSPDDWDEPDNSDDVAEGQYE